MSNKVVICAIMKDEEFGILEWLIFHILMGISHFYLYDNESSDETIKIIQNSAFSNMVTLVPWAERPGQLSAYRHFIETFSTTSDWVAFIDCDEFLHMLDNMKISLYLSEKKEFSAVLVNWLIFGSSGHLTRPKGLVIESYINRLPDLAHGNRHVKTIARCKQLRDVGPTPHVFLVDGKSCNSMGKQIEPQPIIENASFEPIVINHYFTKSKEEWTLKRNKGKADTSSESEEYFYNNGLYQHVQTEATVIDTRIVRFSKIILSIMRDGSCK